MRDPAQKTRHAVQMAIAARALANAADDDHRKRVVARYAFVYLDDVIKFAAPWRNQLLTRTNTRAAAESALPALDRLRQDWLHYEDIRNYLGAKRQPRNVLDPVANELESFVLWADVGELAVTALVDDAVEIYAQLAAVTPLAPIELEPACPDSLVAALRYLDGVGEEGAIEIAASSFGADRPGAFPVRMGGEVGRLVPLMNDVAENLQTLRALVGPAAQQPVFDRLIRCQLPTELYELLRLAIGSEPGGPPSAQHDLLALYSQPGMSPPARKVLEDLRDWVNRSINRTELRDWRRRIGAHIDEASSWAELEEGMLTIDLGPFDRLIDVTLENLEACALQPHGPLTLLFPARKLRTLIDTASGAPLSYGDVDATAAAAAIRSALPPAGFEDAHYMVWTNGGYLLSAAIAGMQSARGQELRERIERREHAERSTASGAGGVS